MPRGKLRGSRIGSTWPSRMSSGGRCPALTNWQAPVGRSTRPSTAVRKLLRAAGVFGHRGVGGVGLLGQAVSAAAAVAQAAHAEGRGQRARHTVSHRVGDAEVQHVAGQAVVEGVPADRGRGLEPPGQGERAGFAGERGRAAAGAGSRRTG